MSDSSRPFSQMTRRHWLGHLASTALGVPAIQFFSSLEANAQQLRKANRSCIVLWMGGGPSHLDIWDLKPDSEKNGGPFQPIDTSAPGVKISEHLPKVAKQMHHLSIIRSLDSKEGNHDRGTYLMHTGYAPNPTVVHPGLGSYCAMELGEQLETSTCRTASRSTRPEPAPASWACRMPRSSSRTPTPRSPISSRPRTSTSWRMERRLRDARPGREPVRQPATGPGGRRSQGGLRQDAADDELALPGRLQPRRRARQRPRRLRPRLVRLGLPDGPAAGRAGGHLRRGLPRRLGHPRQQLRHALAAGCSPSSTRGWRRWSPTWPTAACSTPRRSSGWASSAARRGSTRTPAATTGRGAGRSSSAAAA